MEHSFFYWVYWDRFPFKEQTLNLFIMRNSKNTDRPHVISVTATDSKVPKGNSKRNEHCHNTERGQKVYNWVKSQEILEC